MWHKTLITSLRIKKYTWHDNKTEIEEVVFISQPHHSDVRYASPRNIDWLVFFFFFSLADICIYVS